MRRNPFAPIRIVVADDSPVARAFLVAILEAEPDMEVVGEAIDGRTAVDLASTRAPDVILMDGHMPKVDGFAATRRIMETCPTRIIIVTMSYDPQDVRTSMQALEAGALTVIEKPFGPGHPRHQESVDGLLGTIRALSEVSVVRRWKRVPVQAVSLPKTDSLRPRILAIAGSTGAPRVLASILGALTERTVCPVLVVQHISPGFVEGFTTWLNGLCPLPVTIAKHRDVMRPAHVYVAPEGYHLCAAQRDLVQLASDPPVGSFRPSADRLFETVAEVYGRAGMGVLLTGMGRDGADGLARMAEAGAVTVVQDPETCIVPGMPLAAIKAGAARHIVPGDAIGAFVARTITRMETVEDEHKH